VNKKWFTFHAMWRATAINITVEAPDEDTAFLKAARRIKRMIGGDSCLDLKLIKETNSAEE